MQPVEIFEVPRITANHVRVEVAGRSHVLRVQREGVMAALRMGAARAAQAMVDGINDAACEPDRLAALCEEAEGWRGYVIMRCWADPAWLLDTRTRYDAAEFGAARGLAPSVAAGLACVDELMEAGWTARDVAGVCGRLLAHAEQTLREVPSEAEVTEAEGFSGQKRGAST